MPVKSSGFALNYQPEWTYEDGTEGGGGQLVAHYEDDAEEWHLRLPAKGSIPPTEVGDEFVNFRLERRTASRLPGDKVRVDLVYKSAWPVDEEPVVGSEERRYSMQLALGEEPILTFAAYDALDDEEKLALSQIIAGQRYKTEEGKEEWRADVVSADGLQALAKIEKGVEAYLEPGMIWRERVRVAWDDREDEVELSKVGKIYAAVPGDPPTGGNRNYLYLGAQLDQDESGEFAEMVREWQMSGRNGWDADLYDPS
jgi:hypothetical protein